MFQQFMNFNVIFPIYVQKIQFATWFMSEHTLIYAISSSSLSFNKFGMRTSAWSRALQDTCAS